MSSLSAGESFASTSEAPLNQAQLGIYLSCMQRVGESVYNNPTLLRFEGIDIDRLKIAVEKTLACHPGLLSQIAFGEDGLPLMRYHPLEEKEEIVKVVHLNQQEWTKAKESLIVPFNLDKDRLFRFAIYEVEGTVYLFMDIHHIVYDGFSMTILLQDMAASYEGKEIEKETYTAFDAANDELKRREQSFEEAKKWYLETFRDVEEVTIPAGDKKETTVSIQEKKASYDIDFDKIKAFCKENDITPAVLTTSAFGYLLSEYANTKKTAFATIYIGRHDHSTDRTVSMFVRTLPVLSIIDPKETTLQHLAKMKAQIMGTRANDAYSFSELASSSGYTSDILFAYQGTLYDMQKWGEEKAPFEHLPYQATGEKMSFSVYVENGKMVASIQYQANLYSEAFIEGFLVSYGKVLLGFLTKAKTKEITIVDEKETKELIALSYGGDLDYQKDKTFIDILLEQIKKHPNKKAVIAKNGSYTYGELDEVSNRIASYLLNHGLQPNDFVVIKTERVKEFISSLVGIMKAGGAYIPVDPTYPADRIQYMIEDSGAKFVLDEPFIEKMLEECKQAEPINLSKLDGRAYMIYTSGSTGKPKGVVILHKSLVAEFSWHIAAFDLSEQSVAAVHASFSFDASVHDIFASLSVGGELHIISEEVRMDLDLIYAYLRDNKITGLTMSTQIGMSLINAHPDLKLNYMVVGGEKLLPTKKTNIRVYNGYGPTEFTVCSSAHLVDQEKDKDIPIGRAVPNSYSFICDPFGNLLPRGMIGELCLSGIQMSCGYYNRPELNEERFIPCPFLPGEKMYKTGDLAKYNEEGELEYCGRIDFQVKLRGFRIELGEVENAASSYPHIKQVLASVKNKQLVLYYSAEGEIDENDLKAKMGSRLTEYMVPTVFIRLDEMPMTPGGKIDRKALPEPTHASIASIAPRNELEEKVYQALARIVGYGDFGVTDDFDLIGLTSLSAMQFTSELSSLLHKSVRVSELVNHSSIEKLLAYLNEKDNDETHALQKDYPLTSAQQGILTEALAHPDTTIYNVPTAITLPKGIDLDRFAKAVKEALDAHPYLKVRLISNEEGQFRILRQDESDLPIGHFDLDTLEGGAQSLVRPFDIIHDPLTRVALLKGKSENVFFFDAHHMIFDGESLDVLMKDIDRAYKGEKLEKEAYSEFDLSLDEEKLRQGEEYNQAKQHYASILEGRDIDCLPVPDHAEKGRGKQEVEIDVKADKEEVESFLSSTKTTPNSLWIASFGLALAKFLNRNDAIFATVYNGRNDARLRSSIGMFVHTLPVTCDPFPGKKGTSYVQDVAEQIKKSMANDSFSFADIAHEFEMRADILFVYEGKIAQGYSFGDMPIEGIDLLSLNEAKAALLLSISDTQEGYRLHFEYDGDRYQAWSVTSLLEATSLAFNQLLHGVDPDDMSFLNEEKKAQLDQWNATDSPIERTDLISTFKKAAKTYPNNVAVIYKDKKLTYREVDEITDRIAFALAKQGLGKGKVASILINRSQNMVLSALGVMKTGAAYQPLDCSYPEERLLFMVEDASSMILIADEELLSKLPSWNKPVLFTKDFASLPKEDIALQGPSFDDLMILLYTSGTTGTPKGVMLTQGNLINFCHWYHRYYDLKPNHVVAAYAGFGFDASMMDLYPALTCGASVCVVPDDIRMNLDQLEAYFEKNGVTHSFMTTQVGRLFASEIGKSSLHHLSVGGEKLVPIEPPAGYTLHNGYGPTECTIFSTAHPVSGLDLRVPIGKPLDNYCLYVVDRLGKELPIGALGELYISGYGVGLGYLNLPEKTAASFVKNPFSDEKGYERAYRTGDIVRRLYNGEIDFIGRNDGQVKIRGFRIELGEVEMAIRSFPGIKDATVQAFDSESGGKFLAAYFTASSNLDINAIKAHIKQNKPAYMVPSSIMQLDAIPLNQNQKVNKRALPKPVFVDSSSEYVAPETPLEKEFAEAYQQILGLDKVGANDSFFDIGGTSLSAAKVVVFALNKGYSLSYQDIFAHPSPRELAAYMQSNKDNAPKEEKVVSLDDAERSSLSHNNVAFLGGIKKERELGKVLLAGATGFLGIHIFRELLAQGIETTILVRSKTLDPLDRIKGLLMYYFDSPLEEEVEKYVKVVGEDITDDHLLERLEGMEFDTIINAAAIVKHFASSDIIEKVNVGGVKNLIEVAKAKKARFIQVSTLSVAGENIDHKFPSNYKMKEDQLYFGQDISNKYCHSKFKAEEAILDAIENDGLDAKIIRVGNLMPRQSDGEFQINSVTNAFMRNLKGYKVLGQFPISGLHKETDFSPIDETAKTILLLATTPVEYTVFHSFNCHRVQMADIIAAMNLIGIKIDNVDDETFKANMKGAMLDEKKAPIVSSLISYASSDNRSHEFIDSDVSYSVQALYRLGYRWPITDFEYLKKAIEALETLGFFDRDDI